MKLLIAEDDASLRKILVTLLEKNSYSVDAVADGMEALDYLRSGSYDGAILDRTHGEKRRPDFNADGQGGNRR